jgi:hypothetical protein
MTMRIIIGGLVGGIILFAWGAIAWMVAPLYSAQFKVLPNEDAVRAVLREGVTEHAMFGVPGMDYSRQRQASDHQAMCDAFMQKHREGPVALLVVDPRGSDPMAPAVFLRGVGLQVLVALIGAWLLAKAGTGLAGYGSRVQFVTVLGLFASLLIDGAYWNWFSFPASYTVTALADHTIGWLLVGLALAGIVKPRAV